jgi:hypothetical protein
MYRTSQTTRGRDTASQTSVRFEAVWHHACSPISDGEGGATAAATLEAARLARALEAGDKEKSGWPMGAGDAVEARELLLVGEGSKAGKLPSGFRRVVTIVAVRAQSGGSLCGD